MSSREFFQPDDDPAPRGQRLLRNPDSLDKIGDRPGVRPIGTRRTKPQQSERDRLLRNVAMAVLAKNGFSERQIARLFGLAPSRVHVLVERVSTRAQKGADADSDSDDG